MKAGERIYYILVILVISSLTSAWPLSNKLNEVVDETPEFEVVHTDLATGRQIRSPLLESDVPFQLLRPENVFYNYSTLESEKSMREVISLFGNKSDLEIGHKFKDKRQLSPMPSGRVTGRAATPCQSDTDCTDPGAQCDAGAQLCRLTDCTADATACGTLSAPGIQCLNDDDCPPSTPNCKTCQVPKPPPIQTPMVFYRGTGYSLDARCKSVPSAIHDIQVSGIAPSYKKAKLITNAASPENFEYDICNWLYARLECVPDRMLPNPPIDPNNPPDADADSHPLGTCRCLLGLGEQAIWVNDVGKRSGISHGACFIPANSGIHSKCGHDVSVPSGAIDFFITPRGKKRVHSYVGNSAKFCAPGSECRTGYNYVGLRCSCKKHHIWIRKTKICKSDGSDQADLAANVDEGTRQTKITDTLLLLPLVNAISALISFTLN